VIAAQRNLTVMLALVASIHALNTAFDQRD